MEYEISGIQDWSPKLSFQKCKRDGIILVHATNCRNIISLIIIHCSQYTKVTIL
jgi:hypothetical protein